jgi:transcriptional regulator with XRE-family HTH domain
MSTKRKPSSAIEPETQKALNLVRQLMRRHKKTQLAVQGILGWGRSSISQMMTGQKSARYSQVMDILRALKIQPADFFIELYSVEIAVTAVQGDELTQLEGQVQELTAKLEELTQRLASLEALEERVAFLEDSLGARP